MQYYNDLVESLKAGFLDYNVPSKSEYHPQLLINDKAAKKKVLTTILHELSICKEFWFSVAFVTKSGVATLMNLLNDLNKDGIKGKILVSQYQNFTQPEALRALLNFTNLDLRIAIHGEFHAKGYLFKKNHGYDLIIGSSNLTANALCNNKEWNLKVSSTENGNLITSTIKEFQSEFDQAVPVDEEYICIYEKIYKAQLKHIELQQSYLAQFDVIKPNSMQVEALDNLKKLRIDKKNKALLISATGTGKTYLSAFDVKDFNPRKCLFVVHRGNIAKAALKSYEKILGATRTLGLYSGENKDNNADFLFSTIQTVSKDEFLTQYTRNYFDYIIIDETHRSGAPMYQKLLNHFSPNFLLGMTATPERTDGFDIFKQFDYNIAYEIRLHRALEEQMLCPFHYFGVTDISVNNKILEEDAAFNLLTANERVASIIEKAKFYGCDNGTLRGLIFCSKVEEAKALANAFNLRGIKSLALSGDTSVEDRSKAISRLESDSPEDKLDYLFTVDIFNEGIDIPRVNQIIMLRPTQSAIIFVQQLGRGLRKTEGKEFVTVIDFIGNYSNNYLVPIALYGDTSYNKDILRKLIASGSNLIPGASTVNFDKIAKERIYNAIDSANLSTKKDLLKDYKLLKYEIGRNPMMMDFIEHGARDPYLYVENSKSYFNFVAKVEDHFRGILSPKEINLLELFSLHIADGKRIEEVLILIELILNKRITATAINNLMFERYGLEFRNGVLKSCLNNLNFTFINSEEKVVINTGDTLALTNEFLFSLNNSVFREYLMDLLKYAQTIFTRDFDKSKYIDGFSLYHKYSRKDVCRILNWEKDEQSTMFGYRVKHNTCPIFVNYQKEDHINESTRYEDQFVNNYEFVWMSRSRRTLQSEEIKSIQNHYKNSLRLPLFIKKSNDEGNDFYYMGELTPTKLTETTLNGYPIVRVNFQMSQPVEESIYQYLTDAVG